MFRGISRLVPLETITLWLQSMLLTLTASNRTTDTTLGITMFINHQGTHYDSLHPTQPCTWKAWQTWTNDTY